MQRRAWDYPIIVPSTAFYSPPPMCLASHPYQRLLLLLCLGLSIRWGLALRKAQSLEIHGQCNYRRHPNGSTSCQLLTFNCNHLSSELFYISLHLISFHCESIPVSLFHFFIWLWDFISFHKMKCFILWNEIKSCNFNEDQFGTLQPISLNFMSSHSFLLFSLLIFFLFCFCFFSISFNQFLLQSRCFTSFPDFNEYYFCKIWSISPQKPTPHSQSLLCPYLSSCHNPCAGHLSKRLLLLLCLGVGLKKTTKPRAPATKGMPREPSTAPTLLPYPRFFTDLCS